MLNSCVVNPKVDPLSSHSSDELWAPRHQVRTHLSAAFLPCNTKLAYCMQATTERCGNLATRLRVGPLCCTIQPSPLSAWPRRSTDEPTMQVDSPPWLPTLHPGWALARRWCLCMLLFINTYYLLQCIFLYVNICTTELGARRSSAKIWGWAVTRRKVLKWLVYSHFLCVFVCYFYIIILQLSIDLECCSWRARYGNWRPNS